MKKSILALMLIGATVLCVGCSASKKAGDIVVGAGESGIYIDDDGQVTYSFSEAFNQPYYNEEDLKSEIESEIDQYNGSLISSEDQEAKVENFWVEDGLATAILKFPSTDSFINYLENCNGEASGDTYIGSIKDAEAAGASIAGEFTRVEDGKLSQNTALSAEIKQMDADILIVHDQYKVEIENANIVYLSSNCRISDGIVTIQEEEQENEVAYIVFKK